MDGAKQLWQKGRGKLGALDPLIGSWQAEADSPQGPVRCLRTFSRILGGSHVLLEARWEIAGTVYEEHAVYGVDAAGQLAFWSFTSDGQRSEGTLAEAGDLHPEAVGFEARMPAGLARLVYWPAADGGIDWVAESKEETGWSRFAHHCCHRVSQSADAVHAAGQAGGTR
jgi:hypothetical protein